MLLDDTSFFWLNVDDRWVVVSRRIGLVWFVKILLQQQQQQKIFYFLTISQQGKPVQYRKFYFFFLAPNTLIHSLTTKTAEKLLWDQETEMNLEKLWWWWWWSSKFLLFKRKNWLPSVLGALQFFYAECSMDHHHLGSFKHKRKFANLIEILN